MISPISYLVPRRVRVQRVLGGQHHGRDEDADHDDVAEVTVIADLMALDSKPETICGMPECVIVNAMVIL